MFIIGNSSSGIIESSLLKKYSINILPRQKGREHDKNVFHCKNYKKDISLKINEILKKYINFTSIFDRRKQIGLPSNFILKKCLALNKSLMKTYIIGDGMFAKNLKIA